MENNSERCGAVLLKSRIVRFVGVWKAMTDHESGIEVEVKRG